MKTLFIDTSTHCLIVSILHDGQTLFSVQQIGLRNHGDILLPTIEKGLKASHLHLKELDRIVVGIGPGAYTGLRVSLTVAKMISWTLSIPLYTVSSLDVIACGLFNQDGIIAILPKAKANHVYGKIIAIKNQHMTCLVQECFSTLDAFKEVMMQYPIQVMIDENNIQFDPQCIDMLQLEKVEDIALIEPNYLRGAM